MGLYGMGDGGVVGMRKTAFRLVQLPCSHLSKHGGSWFYHSTGCNLLDLELCPCLSEHGRSMGDRNRMHKDKQVTSVCKLACHYIMHCKLWYHTNSVKGKLMSFRFIWSARYKLWPSTVDLDLLLWVDQNRWLYHDGSKSTVLTHMGTWLMKTLLHSLVFLMWCSSPPPPPTPSRNLQNVLTLALLEEIQISFRVT